MIQKKNITADVIERDTSIIDRGENHCRLNCKEKSDRLDYNNSIGKTFSVALWAIAKEEFGKIL